MWESVVLQQMEEQLKSQLREEMFWKSINYFFSYILRGGKVFTLFFENEGREISKNKTQLGNGIMFRTKRCIKRARMMMKGSFNYFSIFGKKFGTLVGTSVGRRKSSLRLSAPGDQKMTSGVMIRREDVMIV